MISMDWWKVHRHQFPRIAQLARKLLCVTATSTPSEIVFSDCGLALTAKRSRLKGNECTTGSSNDSSECWLPYYDI